MEAKVGKGEEYGFILRFCDKGMWVLRHVSSWFSVKLMEKADLLLRKLFKLMIPFLQIAQ